MDATTADPVENQAGQIVDLMLSVLSDGLDHPELWDIIPDFVESHPSLVAVLNQRYARSWSVAENQSLKQTIKELQSIQTTVVDMEDKLKDLQSKLRGETTAKQELSDKFDEVSSAEDVREVKSMCLHHSLRHEGDYHF
jgi:hypothetical protein